MPESTYLFSGKIDNTDSKPIVSNRGKFYKNVTLAYSHAILDI